MRNCGYSTMNMTTMMDMCMYSMMQMCFLVRRGSDRSTSC